MTSSKILSYAAAADWADRDIVAAGDCGTGAGTGGVVGDVGMADVEEAATMSKGGISNVNVVGATGMASVAVVVPAVVLVVVVKSGNDTGTGIAGSVDT